MIEIANCPPALSIILVNWNTREFLALCLASLEDVAEADDLGKLEVFVVDNASQDGSVEMLRERFSWVRLIINRENVGFARANNQAIVRSQGEHILLLNTDTEVYPGALKALINYMYAHERVGAVGPMLLNPDGSLQPSAQPMLTPEREFWRLLFLDRAARKATYAMEKWDSRIPHQVEILKGACLLLRREALKEVGLLDESYFMYTEEVDLCYRLAKAGWQLWWVPEARIIHFGGASSRQVAEEMYLELYRSKTLFYRKFGGNRRAKRFKWWVSLAYVPRFVLMMVYARFNPSVASRAHTYQRLLVELPGM